MPIHINSLLDSRVPPSNLDKPTLPSSNIQWLCQSDPQLREKDAIDMLGE